MIDVKVTTVGGPEIARQLEAGPGAIRSAVRAELAQIGDEIVSRASALAPKRKGILASRILWYFGSEATTKQRYRAGIPRFGGLESPTGPVVFTARPTGSVAHLIERGVHGPRKAHFRRETRVGTVWTRKGKRRIRNTKGRTWVKEHAFHFPAHPFFIPAVESVGNVAERLQAAMGRAAEMARDA